MRLRRNPSLADNFNMVAGVRIRHRAVILYNRKPTWAVDLVAQSRAVTRIRDGMTSGMTDAGLARIATRNEGIADTEEFVSAR